MWKSSPPIPLVSFICQLPVTCQSSSTSQLCTYQTPPKSVGTQLYACTLGPLAVREAGHHGGRPQHRAVGVAENTEGAEGHGDMAGKWSLALAPKVGCRGQEKMGSLTSLPYEPQVTSVSYSVRPENASCLHFPFTAVATQPEAPPQATGSQILFLWHQAQMEGPERVQPAWLPYLLGWCTLMGLAEGVLPPMDTSGPLTAPRNDSGWTQMPQGQLGPTPRATCCSGVPDGQKTHLLALFFQLKELLPPPKGPVLPHRACDSLH